MLRAAFGEHAQSEHQHANRGEFQFLAHSMLLGEPDVKREPDVGAAQGLENFSKKEHARGASRLRKKGLPQPAASLLSLPEGEKIEEGSQFYAGC